MGTHTGDINTLFSQMGTRQGDPLGGALFALGHLRALRSTTTAHPLCIFPSYADDTYIAGPVDVVLPAFHTLQDQLSSVGLTIQLGALKDCHCGREKDAFLLSSTGLLCFYHKTTYPRGIPWSGSFCPHICSRGTTGGIGVTS
ncbi:hypothetical protein R1flu_022169 [Riccia fluitans]|uniref:Reverse transcriptase domain-containing protein n=1 Tax=Riccia fluitans TaxID=41844 RepID=A0ABD1ZSP8_9MARC